MGFELMSSQLYGWTSNKLLRKNLFQSLILAKKMSLIFKMTCSTFVFLQILLVGRLIRSYLTHLTLNSCKTLLIFFKITIAKLLNQNGFQVVKLPLTVSGSYNISVRLFSYLKNKLFTQELKTLNYDGLWENKKFSDENQRFDWIKLIH